MLGFVLYILSVASQPATILYAPIDKISQFAIGYNISSLVIGILITLALSNNRSTQTIKSIRIPLLFTLAVCATEAAEKSSLYVFGSASAALFLILDYSISQSKLTSEVNLFRFSIFTLNISHGLLPQEWTNIILLKVAVGVVVTIHSILKTSNHIELLRIGQPIKYIITTHAAYFGTLAAVSKISSPDQIKLWYIGTQLAFMPYLKTLDYAVRIKQKGAFGFIRIGRLFIVFTAAALVVYSFNMPNAIAIFIGGMLLVSAERYLA